MDEVRAYMPQSKTDEWATPRDLFESLDRKYHFNLDPCANAENHVCERYFTKEENGLLQDWSGARVFCNPPYGKPLRDWVKKASEERDKAEIIVMLLPARTDTRWFHEYLYGKAQITFIKGRLRYNGCKDCAPFPSMIVVL